MKEALKNNNNCGAAPSGLRPQSEGFPQRAHRQGGLYELNPVPYEGLREVMEQLMRERFGDQPLFRRQCHWQAVYRVMVDYGWCLDADYDMFGYIVSRISPEKVNAPYNRDSVKNITQTAFLKPFCEWRYDRVMCKRRAPYERMRVITETLFRLVDAHGLRPDNV